MGYYSYKIEHDFGLAPNPFGEYCTLAICKSGLRKSKNLNIGDWIFGAGSKALKIENHLIYAMQVEEKIGFNDYWKDPRFQYKKPVLNGSLVQLYGDNIYHTDEETQEWIQEDSAHSLDNGVANAGHMSSDLAGEFVLISKKFYYFGDHAVKIPDEFQEVFTLSRAVKGPSIPEDIAKRFVQWITQNYSEGILGDPISWKKYYK